jgi:deoxyribonuclease-4
MSPLSFRFGTVGAPLKTPKKPGGSAGAVVYSSEIGLFGLELGWVRAVRVTPETCAQIKAVAQEKDVAISIHAPYYINLNADDEEWPKSRQRLMDAAIYGYQAGATDIIFHPGSYFERPPQDVLPLAIQRLQGCVDELRGAGNPVILRPETMGKSAMLGSLEDVLRMSQEIQGVAPCIDFAHLHARPGDGSINTVDEWSQILKMVGDTLGDSALKSLHCHISGIEYGAKGEREHLPLDESDLDLQAIFRPLLAFGCGGRILCESPVMEEDALKMKQLWSEISGESDA